jgi:hypothetical protein
MAHPNQTPDTPFEERTAREVAEAIDMRLAAQEEEVRAQEEARRARGEIITDAHAETNEARIATYQRVGMLALDLASESLDGQHLLSKLSEVGGQLRVTHDRHFQQDDDENFRDRTRRMMMASHIGEISNLNPEDLFTKSAAEASVVAETQPPENPEEAQAAYETYDQDQGYEDYEAQYALEREQDIDFILAMAGPSVMTYSDGPPSARAHEGYQGHGVEARLDRQKQVRINGEIVQMPEVKQANQGEINESVAEIMTFTPEQETITVGVPQKKMVEGKRGIFGSKYEEKIVDVPTAVQVDKYDPVSGERLVRVGYTFDPRLAGDTSTYAKRQRMVDATQGDTFPVYGEVNHNRPGGHLSYGMVLPESLAKDFQDRVAADPYFARDFADKLFTSAVTPFSQEDYEQGAASNNRIRPPYDELPDGWRMYMFDATHQHRDRDNLKALPRSKHGSSDLIQTRDQSLLSSDQPANIRTAYF